MFVLRYRSDNGYTGVLRTGRSLSIYDPSGMEVLHTSSPAFRNYDELVEHVDNFPHFLDVLFDHTEDKNG